MGFLAEVEMRRHGVFEEVRDQIPGEYEKRGVFFQQLKARGNDFEHGCGQHETGTQRHKILQIRTVPVLLNNDGAAENVGSSSRRAKQKTQKYRVHGTG